MMNKHIIFYLYLLIIACCFYNCRQSSVQKDYSNLMIAYNVLIDPDGSDYEVFVMDIDGTNKRNLSKNPGVDWVYHAYGKEVYYISDRETSPGAFLLYKHHIDSIGPERISFVRLADSWIDTRKQGTEIILKPHSSLDSVFYIIDQDNNLLQKVDVGLPYFNDPLFVNDGEAIVFRGAKMPQKQDSSFVDELYYFDLELQELKQITVYPASDTTAMWYHYHAGPPRWNASLQKITYPSMQNGSYSIFATDIEGTGSQQLTKDGFSQGWHSWDSDGTLLVYDGTALGEEENYDIYIKYPDSDTSVRLTMDSWYQQAPVFLQIN